MTIKQAAEQYKVSTQAIYQRLKKSGKQLSTLKDSKTGHLTPEGAAIVCNWFDNHVPTIANDESARLQLEQLTNERNALVQDVARLEAELRTEREMRAMLEGERDALRQALDRSQQLQAMTLARLPEQRTPFLLRLLGRRSSDHDEVTKG